MKEHQSKSRESVATVETATESRKKVTLIHTALSMDITSDTLSALRDGAKDGEGRESGMSELKPLICPQCGAHINRTTYRCEYCGTQFKQEAELNPFQFEVLRPGAVVLRSQCTMPLKAVEMVGGREKASELVIKQMAKELASKIAPYMDVAAEVDLCTMDMRVNARLRIIEPTGKYDWW